MPVERSEGRSPRPPAPRENLLDRVSEMIQTLSNDLFEIAPRPHRDQASPLVRTRAYVPSEPRPNGVGRPGVGAGLVGILGRRLAGRGGRDRPGVDRGRAAG